METILKGSQQYHMLKTQKRYWTIVAFIIVVTFAAPAAFAEERNIGKHSQAEIRTACNNAGGSLLGVSEFGSYGCEVPSKGTMILCDKEENCKGYTQAKSSGKVKMVLKSLKLCAFL